MDFKKELSIEGCSDDFVIAVLDWMVENCDDNEVDNDHLVVKSLVEILDEVFDRR